MLTTADLDAIAARLDAASPGPWRREGLSVSVTYPCSEGWEVADCGTSRSPDAAPSNAEMIAHAPADVRALLAEVERLEAERDEAVASLDALGHVVGEALVAATLAPGETLAAPSGHAITGAVTRLRAERDEAVAALANERGEGEPPGEGWGRNDFDAEHVGVAWYRPENRGDDDVPAHGAAVLWVYREHGDPEWTWEVERYDAHGDDYHHEAHGKAATARDGMRAADRAQGRE